MKNAIIFLIIIFTSSLAYTQTFQKEILESEGLTIEEVQVVENEEIAILSSSEEGVYLTYLDKEGNLIDHLMICDENAPSASVGNKLNLHKLKKFDNGDLLIVILTEDGLVLSKVNTARDFIFSKKLPIATEASALTYDNGMFSVVSSTIQGNIIVRTFDADGTVINKKKILVLEGQFERQLDIAGNDETIFISAFIINPINQFFYSPYIFALDNTLEIKHTIETQSTMAHIESDSHNNIIVRDGVHFLKFNENLEPIWATIFPNFQYANDYFYIDSDDNIIGLGYGLVNELDSGLSTYKYSSNGEILYAKRLLDGFPKVFTGIYQSERNIIATTRSENDQVVIRKLDENSEASDCESIEMCYNFLIDSPVVYEKEVSVANENTDITEDYICNPEQKSIDLRHVCTPIEVPYATFSVVDDTLCFEEELEIIDSTVYQYGQAKWALFDDKGRVAFSSTNRVPADFNVLLRGSYKLVHTVKFANCEYLDSSFIYVNTIPAVELPNDTTVCDEVIDLSFTGEKYSGYEWNIESQDSSIAITESGLYEITVTNECGIDSDAIEIEFIDCDEGIFMPNIIAAKSNSQYDFEIYHKGIIELEYTIYDRWGNPIHRAEMPNLSWSISDISSYSKGVYVVYIRYTTEKGVKKYLVKDLTII